MLPGMLKYPVRREKMPKKIGKEHYYITAEQQKKLCLNKDNARNAIRFNVYAAILSFSLTVHVKYMHTQSPPTNRAMYYNQRSKKKREFIHLIIHIIQLKQK